MKTIVKGNQPIGVVSLPHPLSKFIHPTPNPFPNLPLPPSRLKSPLAQKTLL